MKRLEQHRQLMGGACTLIMVLIMIGLAEVLQEKEIIFPEMTALAIGTLLAPKLSWQVSRSKMIGMIGLCSFLGWGISSMLPLPLGVKILVGFTAAQWLLLQSRTSFAPCISAVVLPILMGTKSLVYPVSAIGLTLLLIGIEWLYNAWIQTERTAYIPLPRPTRADYLAVGKRLLIVSALVIVCLPIHFQFCIAPPILVAFTEFTKPQCVARKQPVLAVGTIFLCSLVGALSRMILSCYFGLSIIAAVFVGTIGMLVILHFLKCYLPPAGALTILPMMIPEASLMAYPFLVLMGTSCLMGSALLFFKEKKAQEEEKNFFKEQCA